MKVYILYHNIIHDGSDVVGVYATQATAEAEAKKLNSEYLNERNQAWNSMSKTDQKFYGPKITYIDQEGWSVTEHEVIGEVPHQ